MSKQQDEVIATMEGYAKRYQEMTGREVEAITINPRQFKLVKPLLSDDGRGNLFWRGKRINVFPK